MNRRSLVARPLAKAEEVTARDVLFLPFTLLVTAAATLVGALATGSSDWLNQRF